MVTGEISHLELSLSTQQGNRKIVYCARLVRVEISVPRLHDVVVREPLDCWVGVLVDGCRMQRDGLVVRDVAPALALADEEFRIEAPGNDRVDHRVIGTVKIMLLGDVEQLAIAVRGPRPVVKYKHG